MYSIICYIYVRTKDSSRTDQWSYSIIDKLSFILLLLLHFSRRRQTSGLATINLRIPANDPNCANRVSCDGS